MNHGSARTWVRTRRTAVLSARRRVQRNRLAGGHHRRAHDHSNDNSHRSVGDICGAGIHLGFTAGRPAGYLPAAQRGPTFPCRGKLPRTASGQRRTTGPRLHARGRRPSCHGRHA